MAMLNLFGQNPRQIHAIEYNDPIAVIYPGGMSTYDPTKNQRSQKDGIPQFQSGAESGEDESDSEQSDDAVAHMSYDSCTYASVPAKWHVREVSCNPMISLYYIIHPFHRFHFNSLIFDFIYIFTRYLRSASHSKLSSGSRKWSLREQEKETSKDNIVEKKRKKPVEYIVRIHVCREFSNQEKRSTVGPHMNRCAKVHALKLIDWNYTDLCVALLIHYMMSEFICENAMKST